MAALDPRRLTASDARWLRALYDPWRWASETASIRLPKAAGVMDLESRPFLRDIYRDMAPEILQSIAKVVVAFGIARGEDDRVLEGGYGIIKTTRQGEKVAPVVVGLP